MRSSVARPSRSRCRPTLLAGAALSWVALALPIAGAKADDQAAAGFWTRPTLLGDLGGVRPTLAKFGISIGLNETSEIIGNLSGGISRGSTYDGLTTMTFGLDTSQAFGWAGGTFNASALQIHGRSLSANYLGNLQTASGIEADRATRLWELWYQQTFFKGAADVKLGQQSIDQEFMVSQGSALYVNTMMGWPMVPSADLYAGGPAYPLSSLGVRLRGTRGPVTVLVGSFNDNPPGGPFSADPQELDSNGARFNLNTGVLTIAEIQYAGSTGTYKLGGWYDSARFADQRYDVNGLPLAMTGGSPQLHEGNYSFYGVADQTLCHVDTQGQRVLSGFARLMGAPGDRNLIDFSVNAGLNLKDPVANRVNDTAGIGFGIAQVGSISGFDEDAGSPVRGREVFIEATYQAQVAPWWVVQPDFQYVISPGAGGADPANPVVPIGDEAVLGLRTSITF